MSQACERDGPTSLALRIVSTRIEKERCSVVSVLSFLFVSVFVIE